MKHKIIISILITFYLFSCNSNKNKLDASGAFEAEEIIISSGALGTILEFNLEEGQNLKVGDQLGYIDSIQLYLKKKQIEAQIAAILSKKPNISIQLSSLEEQVKTAEKEQIRISNLVKSEAAPTKQLDDITANIDVLKKQIEATRSNLEISSSGINNETVPLELQIEQLNDQLKKCQIINTVNGTVLSKFAEANEMTAPGKPLYKIANLDYLILRAYVTSNQLGLIKLNQKVNVLTDDGNGAFKSTEGTLIWINDKAEFTPKTIQTKEERANMVYAIKIKVKNDGSYKIGMYGEIKF